MRPKSFGISVDNLEDLNKFIGPPLKDSFKENIIILMMKKQNLG